MWSWRWLRRLVAFPAAPALADDPDRADRQRVLAHVESGERPTLQYTVTNNEPPGPARFQVSIEVSDGLTCSGDCSPDG